MKESDDILQAAEVQSLISYLDHDPTPMIVMNIDYEILAANTAYQRQFATAGKPYLGHKCYAMSHHYDVPCDQAGEHCPMRSALATRSTDRVLHVHHTPRGPEHVDVELRPIVDARDRVIGFVERLQTVRQASAQPSGQGLVGASPAFNRALGELQRVAASELPVLLLGESGTGKELFARAVHESSPRASGPFVVVDCSGLTDTLFESELFGYERGAFTGASARKAGLVETAKGGTLFLDEIGDVPLPMQVKLLRLIESGTYRRVGGLAMLQADFRLVAATHKPLRAMAVSKAFREDLYYRISAFPIHLPPLRERRGDIPLLVESLLARGGNAAGKTMQVTPDALAMLSGHDWHGNIRELRNVIERARLFADDGQIRPEHLQLEGGLSPAAVVPAMPATLDDRSFVDYVRNFDGSRKALASALGMSERTLYRRLNACGLAAA
jgi:transcriptional regulator with PAS, ATPase and Fis domain